MIDAKKLQNKIDSTIEEHVRTQINTIRYEIFKILCHSNITTNFDYSFYIQKRLENKWPDEFREIMKILASNNNYEGWPDSIWKVAETDILNAMKMDIDDTDVKPTNPVQKFLSASEVNKKYSFDSKEVEG